MPRYELLQYCRQSDIGLSLMPSVSNDLNMQAMPGASNKAFDYLACGLALIVSDLPEWRRMFVEPGYGVACRPEDRASIAAALRNLIGDPSRMRAMGECGRQRIEREWNYERQFESVLAVIEA
jgi:glycosyltransferase involved in cell wall biosynthesis